MQYLSFVVPTTFEKGRKHEQVCKIIARYMALSIPLGMGAEIPVQNDARAGRERSAQVCNGVLSATGLRSVGTEYTSRSCALAGKGSTEAVYFGADGRPERTYCDTAVQRIPIYTEEALLGQSLLGQRVLRGYGRAEQRDDTKIREVSREGRNASATASIESRERSAFSEGALGVPPYGGHKAKPRSTNVVCLLTPSFHAIF